MKFFGKEVGISNRLFLSQQQCNSLQLDISSIISHRFVHMCINYICTIFAHLSSQVERKTRTHIHDSSINNSINKFGRYFFFFFFYYKRAFFQKKEVEKNRDEKKRIKINYIIKMLISLSSHSNNFEKNELFFFFPLSRFFSSTLRSHEVDLKERT